MRLSRFGYSVAAALTLAFAPASVGAQIVIRDPCFYRDDDCYRRRDVDRMTQDRAFERAAQAEERARRAAETRRDREFDQRIRADGLVEARREREAASRDRQIRDRERQEERREQQIERARELRERTIERSLDRAREQREAADQRRDLRVGVPRYRWP